MAMLLGLARAHRRVPISTARRSSAEQSSTSCPARTPGGVRAARAVRFARPCLCPCAAPSRKRVDARPADSVSEYTGTTISKGGWHGVHQ
eukprot:2103660-Prymnesium_polylepis.1